MSDQQHPEKLGGGLMFKNRRKFKPTHPDYSGDELKIKCPGCKQEHTFAVAAWEKKGGSFYSLSLSEPRPRDNGELPREQPKSKPAQPAPQHETAQDEPEFGEPRNPDDDVPF